MKLEKVSMRKEKAKKLWKEYSQMLKGKQGDYLKEIREIKACYYQLSKGRPLINIVDIFKKFGFNDGKEPMLAFAPATERFVRFVQGYYSEARSGIGRFREDNNSWKYKTWLSLPGGTFPRVKRERDLDVRTPVPIIPLRFLPKSLRGCFLLWEVESWEKVVPKKDPILLRKIHGNIYAIMSGWALTDVETMIMKGRI